MPVFSIFGVPDNLDPVLRDLSSYFQCYISSHPLFTFLNPNAISLAHDAREALEKVSKSSYTSGHDHLCGDPVLRFPSHPLLQQHFPHQDVVVFVSEFAGFLGVSLVTI